MKAVAANVVDIATASPSAGMDFLVDTNVWHLVTSTLSPVPSSKARSYQRFIQSAKRVHAKLHACEICLAELAHVVEKTRKEFREGLTGKKYHSLKEFRSDPAERPDTIDELDAACSQVRAIAEDLPIQIDRSLGLSAHNRIRTQLLDGYDALLVEVAHRTGVTMLVTNDRDYIYVPGLTVITNNLASINEAKAANMLSRLA